MTGLTPIRQTVGRALRGRLAANLLAIYLARAANIIMPLALIPIMARTLEPTVFALTLVGQAIGLWIVQLVEYGYDFSATRRLAREDWSQPGWKQIVADTLTGQVFLAVACLIGTMAFFVLIAGFNVHPAILLLAWAYGAMAGATPRWYYYAREEIALFTTVTIMGRAAGMAVSVVGAVLFASGELVMLGYTLGSAIGLGWTLRAVLPKLSGCRWSLAGGLSTLREGAGVFVFKLSKMFYSLGGVTAAGIFAPVAAVAQYAAADRLVRAGINLTVSFTIALFPRLSRLVETDMAAARRLFLIILAFAVGTTSIAAVVVSVFAEPIVLIILGPNYVEAAGLLAVLIWVAPLNLLQYCLGTQWLLPLGLDRPFSIIISVCAVAYAMMALFGLQYGVAGLAYANLAAEALLAVALLGFLGLRRLRANAVT